MPAPTISVIMPVFNARRYLTSAIQSILDQTFADFELILVDDGSTDGSARVLKRFARRDPRIILLQQPNRGPCAAANAGLAIARGEFYARMDHDDIALPERFEKQVTFLRAHRECVAVGTQVLMIDRHDLPLKIMSAPLDHDSIERQYRVWPMFHPSLMARMNAMRAVGCYREKYSNVEDLDLFLRLAEVGRLANLPLVLMKYRQHLSSMCYTRHIDQIVEMEAIFREAEERRGHRIDESSPSVVPTARNQGSGRRLKWTFEKMWAWWALSDGFVNSARWHALTTLTLGPLQRESWLLLWCALRGR
jgi:glycosyltransferase involved in cell wall biosynthesis